jgi:excisionase family DNA binding protein
MTRKSLLTPGDAARVLGVAPATVRLMARTGRLRVAETTKRGIRLFTHEDVHALAELRKQLRRAQKKEL